MVNVGKYTSPMDSLGSKLFIDCSIDMYKFLGFVVEQCDKTSPEKAARRTMFSSDLCFFCVSVMLRLFSIQKLWIFIWAAQWLQEKNQNTIPRKTGSHYLTLFENIWIFSREMVLFVFGLGRVMYDRLVDDLFFQDEMSIGCIPSTYIQVWWQGQQYERQMYVVFGRCRQIFAMHPIWIPFGHIYISCPPYTTYICQIKLIFVPSSFVIS